MGSGSAAVHDGRVLQSQPDRLVLLEADGETVRKTFWDGELAVREQHAIREADRLGLFREALQSTPHASCPRPIDLVAEPDAYSVRMSLVRGLPLPLHLRTARLEADLLAHLSSTLASALLVYVETFDEPYCDFHLRNMIYEPRTGVVSFLDFGMPNRPWSPADLAALSPLEISLGNLIGSSMFESLRPRCWFRLRQHRQALALCWAVVERVSRLDHAAGAAGTGDVSADGVQRAAHLAFDRAAFTGAWYRQLWYRGMNACVGLAGSRRGDRANAGHPDVAVDRRSEASDQR
ncbi:MAG: aminoglycoside phosphotransferase family protein [Actinomycetota bacterium]|jgi:hypothetical protein|nr:aminoglycoside phosphotransferase family protein [Actinomycetota bacterium]